jgi:hypothetical protein
VTQPVEDDLNYGTGAYEIIAGFVICCSGETCYRALPINLVPAKQKGGGWWIRP